MYRYYKAQAFPAGILGAHSGITPVSMGSLGAEPNYEVRPRMVRDYYLVYLLKGGGVLKTRGRTFALCPGDLYILYPDVVHTYATDPENLIEMYWIGFTGADVAALLEKSGFSPDAPVFHSCGKLDSMISQLEEDSGDNRPSNFLALCGGLYRLFGTLMELRTDNEPWQDKDQPLSRIVMEAQNFMNIHYPQSISISDVAGHLNVSRATLAARFREEWNQTPAQYLTYIRLRQAANLLVTTGLSIAEVAHSVGYGDALYFSKVFTKVHKMSPTEYRRARQ